MTNRRRYLIFAAVLSFKQWHMACAAFLSIGIHAIGTGFFLEARQMPVSLQAKEPEASGKPSGARLDRDGALLPDGAVARLGTLKLWGCYTPMAYTPDGKYFACDSRSPPTGIAFFEPETGQRAFELGDVSSGSRWKVFGFGRDHGEFQVGNLRQARPQDSAEVPVQASSVHCGAFDLLFGFGPDSLH